MDKFSSRHRMYPKECFQGWKDRKTNKSLHRFVTWSLSVTGDVCWISFRTVSWQLMALWWVRMSHYWWENKMFMSINYLVQSYLHKVAIFNKYFFYFIYMFSLNETKLCRRNIAVTHCTLYSWLWMSSRLSVYEPSEPTVYGKVLLMCVCVNPHLQGVGWAF